MGFFGNLVATPFKAVKDIGVGAWKMTGGTIGKAVGTVFKAAGEFLTFRWGSAAKTLATGTLDTAKTFLGGGAQALRGGIGVGGTAAAVLLAPTGLGAVATYGATAGVYTMLGG
jgi:hypothetical protein